MALRTDRTYFKDAPPKKPSFLAIDESKSALPTVETKELPFGDFRMSETFLKEIDLIVPGQCNLIFQDKEKRPFFVIFAAEEFLLVLIIEKDAKTPSKLLFIGQCLKVLAEFEGVTVDQDKNAPYWVTIFSEGSLFKYGTGESRAALAQACYTFKNDVIPVKDLRKITKVYVSGHLEVKGISKYPVTTEPPLRIRPISMITIEDAARGYYGSPANLTKECQLLYQNVAGKNFVLDTADFPEFTQAIEYSINTPGFWCYEKIKEKQQSGEFSDPSEVYLRITLGVNQGDSPGIPYVVEIWPPGKCSPIHDHGWSHAVIRVLYGQIQVELFPMLSEEHKVPFATTVFNADDVTWISPAMNQFHRLKNISENGPTCITIQCYMYGDDDDLHYPAFDFIDKEKTEPFYPNSDCDFLRFKETIKKEWENRGSVRR